MVNTAMLRGKIVEKGMDVPGVAARMGVDRSTLYRRIADSDTFTIGEARQITEILGLTNDEAVAIFFSQAVA